MESTQKPEIIFAIKLASNEKPVRSKALLKLRKYIRARSGREEGGFGEDELLKIWKGLFYCMWMQDMPLLQEELSTKISGLLHSFQTINSQLLYFKTFLQTMKREWNGIDRLRMDKYYQLVRFVFREVFEMLKRRSWEPSAVSEFLQLFSAQLLQSSSAAPAGLTLHVLELYTTELARVGATQLTAEQNLTFIEPFCKAMAKTKDRVLLKAIGSNVFNTIVDQVPFAIEDLLREIRQGDGEELDASDGSEDEQDNEELKTKSKKKTEGAQDHGSAEDCDEDITSLPDDMDGKDDADDACGPVLQFDYGAIADRLFEQASHTNIPSFNRSKIYRFVKIFRDLSEGAFPQDEVEDVSTDEDDFDESRRRKKRKKQTNKGQKEQESLKKSKGQSETAADADTSKDTKQKNKKGKKKKRKNRSLKSVEGETEPSNPSEVRGETAESNAELSERDGEIKPDKQQNGPGLKLLKKRRRKKTLEDASEGTADNSETGIDSTSAEIVTSAPLKKKKKLLKKAKDVGDGEKEHDGQAEVNSVSVLTCSISASVEEPSAVTPSKRRSTARNAEVKEQQDSQETSSSKASRKTLVKKKKPKDVVVDVPEPNTNGEAHQEVESVHTEASRQPDGPTEPTTRNMLAKKKRKQKSEASADQIKPKKVKVNGHAGKTSVKRPKAISAEKVSLPVNTENEMKQKQFVLRQKKAPAPIFCKAAGPNTRKLGKKILLPSKPEMKKVTFGLKNNKTMEISCNSRVSPASQSRVAFDPKRTPKSGVLKSPTSSPAVTKRAMAADFF